MPVVCFQAPRADRQATAAALANWPLTPVSYCEVVSLFLGQAPAYPVTATHPTRFLSPRSSQSSGSLL